MAHACVVTLIVLVVFSLVEEKCSCDDPDVSYACLDERECAGDSIDSSYTNEWVACYGYESCTQTTKFEATNENSIRCYGSYSCYLSDLIKYEDDSYDSDSVIVC